MSLKDELWNYKEYLMDLKKTTCENHPKFIAMRALFKKLMEKGFSEVQTTEIVSSFDIEVNRIFVDNLLDEAVMFWVEIVSKIKKECDSISPLLFNKYVEKNKFTFKWPY
jgi:hypothetical protein